MVKPIECRTRKRRYRTELDAKIILALLEGRDHGEIRYYKCHFCSGWHLTSQQREPA